MKGTRALKLANSQSQGSNQRSNLDGHFDQSVATHRSVSPQFLLFLWHTQPKERPKRASRFLSCSLCKYAVSLSLDARQRLLYTTASRVCLLVFIAISRPTLDRSSLLVSKFELRIRDEHMKPFIVFRVENSYSDKIVCDFV